MSMQSNRMIEIMQSVIHIYHIEFCLQLQKIQAKQLCYFSNSSNIFGTRKDINYRAH